MLGLDPIADRAAIRRRTGVLLQRSGFSGDLTVRETLRQWSGTLTAPRPVDEMLDAAVARAAGRRPHARPLRRRDAPRRPRLHADGRPGARDPRRADHRPGPREPPRGVAARRRPARRAARRCSITTHYLEEAETLADRLEIMHAGEIVRSGTPTEIAAGHPSTISFAGLARTCRTTSRASRASRTSTAARRSRRATLQRSLTDLMVWARPQRRPARRPRRPQPEPRDRLPRDRRRPRPADHPCASRKGASR